MLFTVKNKHLTSLEQLRTDILLNAYFIILKYPIKASDMLMDSYIQQHYKMSLKDMCIQLLLNLTFYEDADKNLVLLFKDTKYDAIASLITYGTGVIPGSKILRIALVS